MGWSPEHVFGRRVREHDRTIISHESIYRFIYFHTAQKELREPAVAAPLPHSPAVFTPATRRRSVTFDTGSEFVLHHRLATQCNLKTFFYDLMCPGQKGGIENATG